MFAFSSLETRGLTVAQCRHGLFSFYSTDLIGRMLLHYGEWAEKEVILLTSLLREGDIVLDVGAHIRTLTIPFAKTVGLSGGVYSFEAQRFVYNNLCANIHLNGIYNVRAVNAVVSDKAGYVDLAEFTFLQARVRTH